MTSKSHLSYKYLYFKIIEFYYRVDLLNAYAHIALKYVIIKDLDQQLLWLGCENMFYT